MRRCHCGELVYDVENGVRACGHMDTDPLAEPYSGKRIVAHPADRARAEAASAFLGLPVQYSDLVTAGVVFVMDPHRWEDQPEFFFTDGRLW